MEIKYIKIDDLKFSEYNPRAMTEKEALDLENSLREFGFAEPIVVNGAEGRENVIIGGHQRVNVAKRMGMTEVPVVYVDIPELEREQELNLRLNKNLGHWDYDLLANFDEKILLNIGFESEELDDIFGLEPDEKDDEVPEMPTEPISKLGEIYKLGRHRVMCGDSTKKEDVERLMDGKKAQFFMADPPYNVEYSGGSTNEKKRIDSYKDKWTDEQYYKFLKNVFLNGFEFSDNQSPSHLWFGSSKIKQVIDSVIDSGWGIRNLLIWNKLDAHYGALGARYKQKYEPLLYCVKQGKSRWFGKSNETTVWDEKQPSKNDLHPTMKPVALYVKSILNHTEKDNIVYEAFLGSGTTLIACEKTNRICYGMEIDPKYIDVAINRWEQFTNQKAEKL